MATNSRTSSITLNALEDALIGRLKTGSNTYYLSLAVCALLLFAGSVAGLQATVGGHHNFYGVTRQVSWGDRKSVV